MIVAIDLTPAAHTITPTAVALTLAKVALFHTTIVFLIIAANAFTLADGFRIMEDAGQILAYGIRIIKTYVWIMPAAVPILIIGSFHAIK